MIFEGVSRVFQGSFKKTFKVFQNSILLHDTHCSFPSRRRACFTCNMSQAQGLMLQIISESENLANPMY